MKDTLIEALEAMHREHKAIIVSGEPINYERLYKKAIKALELSLEEFDAATEALERQKKVMGWMAEILTTRGQQNDRLREMIWNLERSAQHGYSMEEIKENIKELGKARPGYEIL